MELFDRVKAILLNPKEEWEVIEAENAPHTKVFIGYLLILALIPAAALFFNYWWNWHSAITEATQKVIDAAVDSKSLQDQLEDTLKTIKDNNPFNAVFGIIDALTMFVTIVGGAYVSAAIINAFSDQFNVTKDFNRTFSLVAYSYTPLCIAGLLYAYPPLASIAPYIGLYGLYLLYIGIKPLINPLAEKLTGYFIMALIVILAAYIVIPKIVQPVSDDIRKNVLVEQAKEQAKKNGTAIDIQKIQLDIERQIRNGNYR